MHRTGIGPQERQQHGRAHKLGQRTGYGPTGNARRRRDAADQLAQRETFAAADLDDASARGIPFRRLDERLREIVSVHGLSKAGRLCGAGKEADPTSQSLEGSDRTGPGRTIDHRRSDDGASRPSSSPLEPLLG